MPESFDALVDDVVKGLARRNPSWATTEGIPGYDHALADVSRESYSRAVQELDGWLARLEGSRGGTELDRESLHFALHLDRFQTDRLRAWSKNPDLASEFMDHLFPLLLRTSRPVEERVAAMAARLEGAREFLAQGRTRVDVDAVPSLWVAVAIESVEQAPAFLDAVVAAGAGASEVARRRLAAVAEDARRALAEHEAWLTHDVRPRAKGQWAVGADAFEELLRVRLMPLSSDELWARGHELVQRFREEFRDAALTVLAEAGKEPGDAPAKEALAIVRRDHPATFEEVVGAYRAAITEARAFTEKRGVASVPSEEDAPLDVVETPAYLRHLVPFAAYIQPARFEARSRGTYLVTPKVDLSAFPYADIRNTTVHEAYPGHHLQLYRVKERTSLARFLVGAPETIEGWALYCEAVMGRHGFTASPSERLVRAKDALWRAVRIVLDVGLHTGRVTYEDAVRMLADETGMSEGEAEAEVKRYTLSPAYNLSYLIGRLEIERLRAAAEAEPGFDEREFHDRLLAQGSLPIPLLERAALSSRAKG